jgi:hypothetical protein
MAIYIVKGNPLRREFNEVEATEFKEEGTYTKFFDGEGNVVAAFPTDKVFGIELKK